MAVPPLSSPSPDEKAQLRTRLRAARRAFAAGKQFAGPHTAHAAPVLERISSAHCVAGYFAYHNEPNILPWLDWAQAQRINTALPRINPESETMDFAHWHTGEALATWRGICQPHASAVPVFPGVVLVPLVGFDRAGHRLGQGGGFYDRMLSELLDTFKIGIGWSVQEVPALTVEPHDVPLDAILTEREWIVP